MPKKVAIVYDWADTRHGGAEKVLLVLHELYPEAPLFTSYREPAATWTDAFPSVQTSFIQRLPRFWRRHKKFLAPFLPLAFESFDFTGFDVIISVASFAAKGILTKPNQTHICYLLTPTRFLYSHTGDYTPRPGKITAHVSDYLRHWDQQAAQRPDKIIAISRLVAERTQQYYGRQVDDIIYPTLIDKSSFSANIDQISSTPLPAQFFLSVGRLTPYKHLDLVVDVCGRHGWPLVVIGHGPDLGRLQKTIHTHAWSHIQLRQNVPPAELAQYYRQATALVAPGLEDFGINLLEANAAGTLVVTHPHSGSRELLDDTQALDLDPTDLPGNLAATLAQLSAQPNKTVTTQSFTTQSFKRRWREKEAIYVNKKS